MYSINIPYLDLETMYNTRQGLLWRRAGDDRFMIVDGDDSVIVKQSGERFVFNCKEDEFFIRWYRYFDIGTDYEDLAMRVRRVFKGTKFHRMISDNKGIRVLRRTLYDTVVISALSFDVSTESARHIVQKTCYKLAEKKVKTSHNLGATVYRTLPKRSQIVGGKEVLSDFVKERTADLAITVARDIKVVSAVIREDSIESFNNLRKARIPTNVCLDIIYSTTGRGHALANNYNTRSVLSDSKIPRDEFDQWYTSQLKEDEIAYLNAILDSATRKEVKERWGLSIG